MPEQEKGTTTLEVPTGCANAAHDLIKYFHTVATLQFQTTEFYATCPANLRANIKIELLAIEGRYFNSILGGTSERDVLKARATEPTTGRYEYIYVTLD